MIKFFRRFGKYSLCTKKYTPFCENKQILIKIQSALIIISNFKTPEYYKQQYGSMHVHTWAKQQSCNFIFKRSAILQAEEKLASCCLV